MIEVSKMIYTVRSFLSVFSTGFNTVIPIMPHSPLPLNFALLLPKLVQSGYPWTSDYTSSQI